MRFVTTRGCVPCARKSRRALTLIEAAVTAVTLAILLLWLVPATAHVRGTSKAGRCLSNLGQIGYANVVYAAQDTANMAIPVHAGFFQQDPQEFRTVGPYAWGGKSGAGEPEQPGEPWTARKGTASGYGPARRPLNQIIYGDIFPDYTEDPGQNHENWTSDAALELDVHRCPTDSGYTGIHSPAFRDERLTSYDHFGTSYGANLFMTAMVGGGNQMMSNSPYLHRMSEIISPSTTLAYQENNGRFAWAASPAPCVFTESVEGVVRGWHGKDWTFNAAFIDGHADTIYMQSYRLVRVGHYPPTVTSVDCITIRGDGWQKDTLPARRVATNLLSPGVGRSSYEGGIE